LVLNVYQRVISTAIYSFKPHYCIAGKTEVNIVF